MMMFTPAAAGALQRAAQFGRQTELDAIIMFTPLFDRRLMNYS